MFTRISTLIASAFFLFLITSCGNKNNEEQKNSAEDTASHKVDALIQFKYDKLISNIPIPFDILRTHAEVPLMYNADALNSIKNLSFYSTSTSKALNLGIYGADLAYNITYEKFGEMGAYLKCAKTLADDLGIPLAFDQNALGTYEKFKTNKDSLEKVIFASYSEVDKTLKSNERIGLASLVVTGGWLEGLYTTLKTLSSTPANSKTKNIYPKIWEQKNHLEMILNLLQQFKDDRAFDSLINDFKGIKSVYDGLSVKTEINEKEIATLTQKVEEVRNKIVAH